MKTTIENDKQRILVSIKEGMTTKIGIARHLNLEVENFDGHSANWYVWILVEMLINSGGVVRVKRGKFAPKTDKTPISKEYTDSWLNNILERNLEKEK
jgi:hypothetical protein